MYAILDNNTMRLDCGRHKRDVEANHSIHDN